MQVKQIEELEKQVKTHPRSQSLKLQLVKLYLKSAQKKNARQLLLQLKEEDPFNSEVYFLLGKNNEGIEAINYYRIAVEYNSENKEALWALCEIYKRFINKELYINDLTKNINSAHEYAGKLLEISKENEKPEIFRYLAFLCRKKSEYNKAIEYLNKAIEISPTDSENYIELSQLLIDIRRYNEALQIARNLANLSPDRYDGYYTAGKALILLGRYEEAVESFKTAIEKDPNYHLSYSQLGKSLLPLERYEEAEEYFMKALKLSPKNRQALFGLADSYLDTGKVDDAIEIFKNLYVDIAHNINKIIIKAGYFTLINRTYLNINSLPNTITSSISFIRNGFNN